MFRNAVSSVTTGRDGDELSRRTRTVSGASSLRMQRVSTFNRSFAVDWPKFTIRTRSQFCSLPKPEELRPTKTTRAPGQSLTGSATRGKVTPAQQLDVGGTSAL